MLHVLPHAPRRFQIGPVAAEFQRVEEADDCFGLRPAFAATVNDLARFTLIIESAVGGKALVTEGKAAGPKRRTFIYVNNRLEGNAISTIAAMMEPA